MGLNDIPYRVHGVVGGRWFGFNISIVPKKESNAVSMSHPEVTVLTDVLTGVLASEF